MALTDATLAKKDAELADLLARFEGPIRQRVERAFESARDHAARALTDTLRRTPDGRQTIRKATQSASYAAALARLDELWTDLAGPSRSSLSGALRDARAAFYAASVSAWAKLIPARFVIDPEMVPTKAGVNAARGIVIEGAEIRDEVGAPILAAKRALLAAVAVAGSRSSSAEAGRARVDLWARTSQSNVFRVASLALGDSLVALDTLAGQDVLKPEFVEVAK